MIFFFSITVSCMIGGRTGCCDTLKRASSFFFLVQLILVKGGRRQSPCFVW